MTLLVIYSLIVLFFSLRTFSFGVWQIKNKNFIGGLVVFLLSLSAIILMFMQFIYDF